MKQIWHYRLVDLLAPGPRELQAQLDEMGQDGWELTAVLESKSKMIFKRLSNATYHNGSAVANPEEPDVVTGV